MVTAENTGKQTQKKVLISFNTTTVGILVYNVICLSYCLAVSLFLSISASLILSYVWIYTYF